MADVKTHAQGMPSALRLNFDNRFTRSLSADPNDNNEPRQVRGAHYSRVRPAAVSDPKIIGWSKEMAEELGLSEPARELTDTAEVLTGNVLLPGMDPHAVAYGGHQFGNWAGQLGDGRAITLGEVQTDAGYQTLQLKGSGPTPYSRTADGLAVLRSSVREFLCSEAMFHLGVPTTRALSLALTGDEVLRDMFYDGHPAMEPGAVVCRVAPSFLRFGNYQLFASRGDMDGLRTLAEFTINTHFPHLGAPSPETYAAWFDEVMRTTVDMVAEWTRVGFVHGVMNTDNMSIHGLTIDYGPYGWLDNFDPDWTPNTTDAQGRRYRFGNQPMIAQWNLLQLAEAIFPLIDNPEPLQKSLNDYKTLYEEKTHTAMLSKLGLQDHRDGDETLVETALENILAAETDMTIFFRSLGGVSVENFDEDAVWEALHSAHYDEDVDAGVRTSLLAWAKQWSTRVATEERSDEARKEAMNRVNPKYVLRNYLAQLAIDDATAGDYSKIDELLEMSRRPYDEQPEFERYAAKRPDWARTKAGCSMLSCSS